MLNIRANPTGEHQAWLQAYLLFHRVIDVGDSKRRVSGLIVMLNMAMDAMSTCCAHVLVTLDINCNFN